MNKPERFMGLGLVVTVMCIILAASVQVVSASAAQEVAALKVRWLYSKWSVKETDHLLTPNPEEANDRYTSLVLDAGRVPAPHFGIIKNSSENVKILETLRTKYGIGSHFIYRCCRDAPLDHFVSKKNCEGHIFEKTYGWVLEESVHPYTTALYRYYNPQLNDHMVSTDEKCELDGYKREHLLGYVVVPTTTRPLLDTPGRTLPGFVGFGAYTEGGRFQEDGQFGRIVIVDNLNDSGLGSLRAAVEEKGARTVIFTTSGTIHLSSPIVITNPRISILGETTPSPGITITGRSLIVRTSQVILRHLRIRPGDAIPMEKADRQDGISIAPNREYPYVHDVVVDHCSVSWAVDENIGISGSGKVLQDVTISNNMIYEALKWSVHPISLDPVNPRPHSMGLLVAGNSRRISIFGNLFAHNNRRNPEIYEGAEVEIIGNTIYNNGDLPAVTLCQHNVTDILLFPTRVMIVNNTFIPGPNTVGDIVEDINETHVMVLKRVALGSKVFLHGNTGPGMTSSNQWDAFVYGSFPKRDACVRSDYLLWGYYKSQHHSNLKNECEKWADEYYYDLSIGGADLETVGAAPHDCHDQRIVDDVLTGSGSHINSPEEVTCPPEVIYPKGWSMISLHVDPTDKRLNKLFPEAVVVYGYEKGTGYVRVGDDEELEVGRGYWILLDQEKSYTLTGQPIPSYTYPVSSDGWAMIGGCSSSAQVSSNNCNIGVIYRYVQGAGYQRGLASEYLEPGEGYWILFNGVDGEATISVETVD